MLCYLCIVAVFCLTEEALSFDVFTCTNISKHTNYHLLPDKESCGRVVPGFRIMGGQDAFIGQFPWMALLLTVNRRGVKTLLCGGSVINDKYILSAAHCFNYRHQATEKLLVRVGEHAMSTHVDCEQARCAPPATDLRVEQIIKHRKYDKDVRREYDIALIRVRERILFSDFVQPICLPTACSTMNCNLVGTSLTTCGWGNNLNYPVLRRKDTLQLVRLQAVSLAACQRAWSHQRVSALQLCLGGSEAGQGGHDSCSGDSGGPAMFLNDRDGPSLHYVLVGVVSEGQPCEKSDYQPPGIYTRVGAFVPWILDKIRQ